MQHSSNGICVQQAQVQVDRGLQDHDVEKRFRAMDKHVAAANGEALRAAADAKALGQRVTSAEWRIDKVRSLVVSFP